MERQVTIAEFSSWSKAHIARSRLEAEGIPCVLMNATMNSLYGGILSIQLRVPAEAEAHAIAVLADMDLGQGPMFL